MRQARQVKTKQTASGCCHAPTVTIVTTASVWPRRPSVGSAVPQPECAREMREDAAARCALCEGGAHAAICETCQPGHLDYLGIAGGAALRRGFYPPPLQPRRLYIIIHAGSRGSATRKRLGGISGRRRPGGPGNADRLFKSTARHGGQGGCRRRRYRRGNHWRRGTAGLSVHTMCKVPENERLGDCGAGGHSRHRGGRIRNGHRGPVSPRLGPAQERSSLFQATTRRVCRAAGRRMRASLALWPLPCCALGPIRRARAATVAVARRWPVPAKSSVIRVER